jgi:exonuclease VII small subunit
MIGITAREVAMENAELIVEAAAHYKAGEDLIKKALEHLEKARKKVEIAELGDDDACQALLDLATMEKEIEDAFHYHCSALEEIDELAMPWEVEKAKKEVK